MIISQDEDQVTLSLTEINELVFQCAGAATRPLIEDHPDYEFPGDRVMEAVNSALHAFGIPMHPLTKASYSDPNSMRGRIDEVVREIQAGHAQRTGQTTKEDHE